MIILPYYIYCLIDNPNCTVCKRFWKSTEGMLTPSNANFFFTIHTKSNKIIIVYGVLVPFAKISFIIFKYWYTHNDCIEYRLEITFKHRQLCSFSYPFIYLSAYLKQYESILFQTSLKSILLQKQSQE